MREPANAVRRSIGLPILTDPEDGFEFHSGTVFRGLDQFIHTATGSSSVHAPQYGGADPDELWNRMYVNPKPAIVSCGFCKSHNAITNPICIRCGAPLGRSSERVYG